jgi:hypothetical protein
LANKTACHDGHATDLSLSNLSKPQQQQHLHQTIHMGVLLLLLLLPNLATKNQPKIPKL